MTVTEPRGAEATFKPRANLIRLLGSHLLASPQAAVAELVKNSHDADAAEAVVTLHDINTPGIARIVVADDGSGMTLDTVTEVWLAPGTDYRARQKAEGWRTPRFGRVPAGDKGVGRFAAHKLGSVVELVTRTAGGPEVAVTLDWEQIERCEYLADAAVTVTERRAEVFTGDRCGTRITVSGLTDRWTETDVEALSRAMTAMLSPFDEAATFTPRLVLDPDPGWPRTACDLGAVLAMSVCEATAVVEPDAGTVTYRYEHTPPTGCPAAARSVERTVPLTTGDHGPRPGTRSGIGSFELRLRIYDDPIGGDPCSEALSDYLAANSGVRVYRSGIRVYDYGEAGNDWLGLAAAFARGRPGTLDSRRLVAAVNLDPASSSELVESTDRSGFVDSAACRLLVAAARSAIQHIAFEHASDRAPTADRPDGPVAAALDTLRARVCGLDDSDTLAGLVDRVADAVGTAREQLLLYAGARMSVGSAADELQLGIDDLNASLAAGDSTAHIKALAQHLEETVDSLGFVARRSGHAPQQASEIASAAVRSNHRRLAACGVDIVNGFTAGNDFSVTCERRLVVGALGSLLDNAAYWLDANPSDDRRLYVGPTRNSDGEVGIVVADNGPGVVDPAVKIIEPFATRKPDAVGLGLYIAYEIMRTHNGRLEFVDRPPADVPAGYDGACAVLIFSDDATTGARSP